MRRTSPRPALLLATVASAAIVLGSGAAAQDPSPSPAASGAVLPGEPQAPFDDGATAAVADPTLVNPRRIRWDAVLVAPDGRTMTVYFLNGDPSCAGLAGIDVQ